MDFNSKVIDLGRFIWGGICDVETFELDVIIIGLSQRKLLMKIKKSKNTWFSAH